MATFTMRLHSVLETVTDIGLTEYPIFDESYREGLNVKILTHFMNQEIGQESVPMFVYAMKRKMNEIMPLYNQRYLSAQIKFDPFNTVDVRNFSENKGSATSNESSESKSTSDSQARAIASNFPQVRLAGNKDYATSGQDNVSQSVADSTAQGDSTTQQDGTTDTETKGFQGNRAALLMDYRATFVNVDMEVIEELEELFMGVLSNGDNFTGGFGYGYWYGF